MNVILFPEQAKALSLCFTKIKNILSALILRIKFALLWSGRAFVIGNFAKILQLNARAPAKNKNNFEIHFHFLLFFFALAPGIDPCVIM